MTHTPWILVVEESRLFHKMVAQVCARLGLRTCHARGIVEAMASLAQGKPAAIVAGHEQRDFSASSLVAALKSDRRRFAIPIAVLSAAAEDGILGVYQPDCRVRRDEQLERNLAAFLQPIVDSAGSVGSEPTGRVLLVEDSATMQRLTASILHLAGYEVAVASHGELALEAMQATDFDLVLMDIEMPVLDGRQTIRRLRESGDNTPVIALTAHDPDYFEEEAAALGFDGFCCKPIRKHPLLAAVRRHTSAPVSS